MALKDIADRDEMFSCHDLMSYFERDQPLIVTIGSYLSRIEKNLGL